MKMGLLGLAFWEAHGQKILSKPAMNWLYSIWCRQASTRSRGWGRRPPNSSGEVASQCGVVITCFPIRPNVKAAVSGGEGILAGARPGTILIDMSSISPVASQEVRKKLAAKGVKMIDAPVSGGEPKAIDGTLSIMAGGDKGVF